MYIKGVAPKTTTPTTAGITTAGSNGRLLLSNDNLNLQDLDMHRNLKAAGGTGGAGGAGSSNLTDEEKKAALEAASAQENTKNEKDSLAYLLLAGIIYPMIYELI